jgi:phage shock protein PspC (stress-responsive transcriptional regulator)
MARVEGRAEHVVMDDTTTTDSASSDLDADPGTDTGSSAAGDDEPTGPTYRRLERSGASRMIAGVAGGVAAYLGIDPIIVRLAFVVATLFGGLGLILYGAGWLLIPEAGSVSRVPAVLSGSRRHQALSIAAALVIGVVALRLVARGPWWVGSGWHLGAGVAWLVVALVLGVVVIRALRGATNTRKVLRRLAIVVALVPVVAVVATLTAELLTGVPLRGGFGSQQWRPTSIAELAPTYRASIGDVTLDLRQLSFPDQATRVSASVGIGRLTVEVPPGVAVSLSAHSGIGNVVYGAGGAAAFAPPPNSSSATSTATPLLVLNVESGIGQVQLVRSAPGSGN